jgi:diaminohydroxyphosphoribosylaminopyrimidine deaminase/5-amino-6-(5-phosphoribosylamino)uracil reductase
LNANVLKDQNVVIIAGSRAMKDKNMILKKQQIRKRGIKVFVTRDERIDIRRAIQILGKMCVTSVLIEGGARIFTSALNAKLVDEAFFFVAPFMIGGSDSMNLFTPELKHVHFKHISLSKCGSDIMIRALPGY